jgi:hypothetical protein
MNRTQLLLAITVLILLALQLADMTGGMFDGP